MNMQQGLLHLNKPKLCCEWYGLKHPCCCTVIHSKSFNLVPPHRPLPDAKVWQFHTCTREQLQNYIVELGIQFACPIRLILLFMSHPGV